MDVHQICMLYSLIFVFCESCFLGGLLFHIVLWWWLVRHWSHNNGIARRADIDAQHILTVMRAFFRKKSKKGSLSTRINGEKY